MIMNKSLLMRLSMLLACLVGFSVHGMQPRFPMYPMARAPQPMQQQDLRYILVEDPNSQQSFMMVPVIQQSVVYSVMPSIAYNMQPLVYAQAAMQSQYVPGNVQQYYVPQVHHQQGSTTQPLQDQQRIVFVDVTPQQQNSIVVPIASAKPEGVKKKRSCKNVKSSRLKNFYPGEQELVLEGGKFFDQQYIKRPKQYVPAVSSSTDTDESNVDESTEADEGDIDESYQRPLTLNATTAKRKMRTPYTGEQKFRHENNELVPTYPYYFHVQRAQQAGPSSAVNRADAVVGQVPQSSQVVQQVPAQSTSNSVVTKTTVDARLKLSHLLN